MGSILEFYSQLPLMGSPSFEDSNVNDEHHCISLYKDHLEGEEVILVL